MVKKLKQKWDKLDSSKRALLVGGGGLAVLLLGIILVVIVLVVQDNQISVKDVVVSNVTDTAVTVSWISDEPYVGGIIFQEGQKARWPVLFAQSVGEFAYDDRDVELNSEGFYIQVSGGLKQRYTHHVTLRNLKPETDYSIRVMGAINGKEMSVTTVQTRDLIEDLQTPDPGYGMIRNIENGDSIALFTLKDAGEGDPAILSAPVAFNGSFSLDMNLFGRDDIEADDIVMVVNSGKNTIASHEFELKGYKPFETVTVKNEEANVGGNVSGVSNVNLEKNQSLVPEVSAAQGYMGACVWGGAYRHFLPYKNGNGRVGPESGTCCIHFPFELRAGNGYYLYDNEGKSGWDLMMEVGYDQKALKGACCGSVDATLEECKNHVAENSVNDAGDKGRCSLEGYTCVTDNGAQGKYITGCDTENFCKCVTNPNDFNDLQEECTDTPDSSGPSDTDNGEQAEESDDESDTGDSHSSETDPPSEDNDQDFDDENGGSEECNNRLSILGIVDIKFNVNCENFQEWYDSRDTEPDNPPTPQQDDAVTFVECSDIKDDYANYDYLIYSNDAEDFFLFPNNNPEGAEFGDSDNIPEDLDSFMNIEDIFDDGKVCYEETDDDKFYLAFICNNGGIKDINPNNSSGGPGFSSGSWDQGVIPNYTCKDSSSTDDDDDADDDSVVTDTVDDTFSEYKDCEDYDVQNKGAFFLKVLRSNYELDRAQDFLAFEYDDDTQSVKEEFEDFEQELFSSSIFEKCVYKDSGKYGLAFVCKDKSKAIGTNLDDDQDNNHGCYDMVAINDYDFSYNAPIPDENIISIDISNTDIKSKLEELESLKAREDEEPDTEVEVYQRVRIQYKKKCNSQKIKVNEYQKKYLELFGEIYFNNHSHYYYNDNCLPNYIDFDEQLYYIDIEGDNECKSTDRPLDVRGLLDLRHYDFIRHKYDSIGARAGTNIYLKSQGLELFENNGFFNLPEATEEPCYYDEKQYFSYNFGDDSCKQQGLSFSKSSEIPNTISDINNVNEKNGSVFGSNSSSLFSMENGYEDLILFDNIVVCNEYVEKYVKKIAVYGSAAGCIDVYYPLVDGLYEDINEKSYLSLSNPSLDESSGIVHFKDMATCLEMNYQNIDDVNSQPKEEWFYIDVVQEECESISIYAQVDHPRSYDDFAIATTESGDQYLLTDDWSIDTTMYIYENEDKCEEALEGYLDSQEDTSQNFRGVINKLYAGQEEPVADDPFVINESGNYSFFADGEYVGGKDIVVDGEEVTVRLFRDINGDNQKQPEEPFINENLANFTVQKDSSLVEYELNSGWNLINIPMLLNATDSSINFLINDLKSQGADILNAAIYKNGQFYMYNDRVGIYNFGDRFTLEPSQGIFLYNQGASRTVTISGQEVSSAVPFQLSNGWNLVGVVNPEKDYNSETLLSSMAEQGFNADTVTQFENGTYQSVIKEDDTLFGNNFNVIDKRGYFIKVNEVPQDDNTFTP